MRGAWKDPSQWRPRQRWEWKGFRIRLMSGERAQRPLSHGTISDLIASLPSKPADFSINSSDSPACELFFYQWGETLDAVVHLWSLRLAGSHRLFPVLEYSSSAPSDKTELEGRLKSAFVAHARKLLESDAMQKCDKKILHLKADIAKVVSRLKRRNSFMVSSELMAEKNHLEEELTQVKCRVEEFRAAVRCVLVYLGESGSQLVEKDQVDGLVELFRFGKEFDWRQIHCVLERECRRLEDGLPIYACRRAILRTIKSNQVTVLIGETGSGKSTQLVQFLADAGLAANGSVVCTQPRRIAALSLGRRVRDESYGCYMDNFVTTYPSYISSQVFGSKVIYMTDYCLLQHCTHNMSLSGISYIIVDEAHERSLNTDLLLALVKKQLLDGSDLRLIIMSATADANKLAKYFYGCSTFNVKGRNFPVEIKYIPDVTSQTSTVTPVNHKSGGFASYVSDVVRMVRFINKTEGDGAILAFLTSQMEVEWACENFVEPTVVVLPLHGKLSFEEQNHVFESYPGRRKIIFSTNVAETSLTIHDVKYVIDCGMEKESRFEPSSGMNVLKVCWISQSSANQRAGRAGRTGPGKCYRLYSEGDFQSMQIHQEPEICKVHLGSAVLRILALGIQKVQDFDFVDAPSSVAIGKAVQNLVHLNAITCRNGSFEVTDVGRHLIKLGIQPKLGKIILDCFSCGLRKEGVVLAAVLTHSSNMFCRVGNEEEKHRADCRKIPFCHHYGDLFTLLSVYKKWEDEHESKSNWCWQNSINAKSMRRCQDTVQELQRSLRHELSVIIPSYWLWDPNVTSVYDKSLKRVILSSLAENLAMYSGYDRLGYEVALTGQHLQLHPSCSLLAYGQKPDWVVFHEILSLPNEYLVCVTAVDHECFHKIQPPLFDILQLHRRKMQMNLISGISNTVLRRLCGKQTLDLQCIVSRLRNLCMDDRISIDVDFEKGELQLFASAKDMEKVSCTVGTALLFEKKRLMDECIEKCLYHTVTGSSPSLALFGSGAEIKHLELGNRCLAVEISHANAHDLDDKELLMMVDQLAPGMVNFHKHIGLGPESEDLSKWGKIVFLTPKAAENAVAKLNELELMGSMLQVVPSSTGEHLILPFPAVKVRLYWPRRPSKGVALVSCAQENADFIINDCSGLEIGGKFINCQLSTKHMNCIFVTGISKDVSESELSTALRTATKRRIIDVHLLRGEPACDLPISTYAKALTKEIASFMPNKQFHADSFRVEVFNPEVKDYMMKALITFNGSLHLEAAKALDHIQGNILPGFLSWQKIQCQHMFYSTLSCPGRVYYAIKKELDSLLLKFKLHKGVSFKTDRTESGAFRLKVYANAAKVIADLRKPLEQLMRGKTIHHPGLTPSLMQVLLVRDGVLLMKAVERDTRTCILYDRQNLNVKVFGSPEQVIEAEKKLINSLLSLNENKQLEIRLRGVNLPPGLMKEVVLMFGPDLQGLKEKIPGIELVLNTRQHTLSVKGSKELKRKVEDEISEVIQHLDTEARMIGQPSEESACPICLCELEEPYKLESCGHVFCEACLIDQFESVTRSHDGFPICCTKAGCKEPVLLVDLRHLLSTDKLEQLFRASLSAYVAASLGTYRFCPTPDCPSVYRVAPKESASGSFECPVCSMETCTKCHVEYHPFISCEMYMEFKEHPDLSLESWRKGKEQVKDCPSCHHTIEKIDGCNHIECRCGKHLCWVCLKWFSSSGGCYDHINSDHPTIA